MQNEVHSSDFACCLEIRPGLINISELHTGFAVPPALRVLPGLSARMYLPQITDPRYPSIQSNSQTRTGRSHHLYAQVRSPSQPRISQATQHTPSKIKCLLRGGRPRLPVRRPTASRVELWPSLLHRDLCANRFPSGPR